MAWSFLRWLRSSSARRRQPTSGKKKSLFRRPILDFEPMEYRFHPVDPFGIGTGTLLGVNLSLIAVALQPPTAPAIVSPTTGWATGGMPSGAHASNVQAALNAPAFHSAFAPLAVAPIAQAGAQDRAAILSTETAPSAPPRVLTDEHGKSLAAVPSAEELFWDPLQNEWTRSAPRGADIDPATTPDLGSGGGSGSGSSAPPADGTGEFAPPPASAAPSANESDLPGLGTSQGTGNALRNPALPANVPPLTAPTAAAASPAATLSAAPGDPAAPPVLPSSAPSSASSAGSPADLAPTTASGSSSATAPAANTPAPAPVAGGTATPALGGTPGANAAIPTAAAAGQLLNGLPMRFEQNVGQTDPTVRFLSRGGGYGLFLTGQEAVLALQPPGAADSAPDVLHMQFVGANPNPEVLGRNELADKTNYFKGSDPAGWYSDVPNYSQVLYRNLYLGVDLLYYGTSQNQLEYDFTVNPGADTSAIHLAFAGAQSVSLDGQGNLSIQTAHASLLQHAPVLYQLDDAGNRQTVTGRYVLQQDGQVGVQADSYDATRPLVIDPVIYYSTYLGGTSNDYGYGVAVDGAGSVYVTGQTLSSAFPTANPLGSALDGTSDTFVTKFSPGGAGLIYSTYLGGAGTESGNAIAVDAAGEAFVTGSTTSSDFPTFSAAQASYGGSGDAFVTKLSAAGNNLMYSTYLGGSAADQGNGIAVDGNGIAYVAGTTSSTNFPTQNSTTTAGGGSDAFVTAVKTDGSGWVNSRYLGGSGNDVGNAIAVDAATNVYVTGSTVSTNFPTAGSPYQAANSGNSDAFVAKLGAGTTTLVYATYLGGTSNDYGYGIAVDSLGDATVAGTTSSSNFPTTLGAYLAHFGGPSAAFVTQFKPAGSALNYSTFFGQMGTFGAAGLAVDSTGNAFITGSYQIGSHNMYMAEIGSAGTTLVDQYNMLNNGSDTGTAIALDVAGIPVLTGFTTSTNLPTVIPFQGSNAGSNDAYVIRFTNGSVLPVFTGISPDTGGSSTDQITSNQNLTLSGTSTASAVVTITRAGVGVLGTATANVSGIWSYSYAGTTLPEGVYAFMATATLNGVTTPATAPFLVTVDRTAPIVTLTAPSTTYSRKPQVTVVATDASGIPDGTTIALDVDLNNNGSFTDPGETGYTTATTHDGRATFTISPNLTVGNTVQLRARVTDLAGNQGTSSTQSLTVNTVGSAWTLTADQRTSSVWEGQALPQLGRLDVQHALDLDQSPGTSMSLNPSVSYSSDRINVLPIVQATLQADNAIALPATITAQLTWNGTTQTAVNFSTTGVSPGDLLEVAAQAVTPVTTTGRYAWTLQVTMNYGTPIVTSISGTTFAVAEDANALGAGWTFGSVNKLIDIAASGGNPAGKLLVYGTGGAAFFAVSGGGFASPADDNGTLANAGGGGYTYTAPTGEVWNFNASGLETTFVTADGQQTTTYTYNGSSQLTGIATADGALSTFTYASSLLSTISTAGGRTYTFVHDGSSNLTSITNPDGGIHTLAYDAHHHLTQETFAEVSTAYAYTSGAMTSITPGSANASTLAPAVLVGLSSLAAGTTKGKVTDGLGHVQEFTLDSAGRPLQMIGKDSGVTSFTRDAAGRILTATDPLNRTTTYVRDSAGFATQQTFPDSTTASWQYQVGFHALTQATDQNGNISTFTYDGQGHQLTAKNALSQVTSYTYANGLLQTVTDPVGHVSSLVYDADRRLQQSIDAQGNITSFTYDTSGNPATTTDPQGHVVTTVFDKMGRMTVQTDPLAYTTTIAYNALGQQTQVTDPLGDILQYQYNDQGLLSRTLEGVSTAAQDSVIPTYDAAGRPIAQRDPKGIVTSFALDPAGRVLKSTDALGGVSATVFDLAGQQTTMRDPLAVATQFSYDSQGRQITTKDALGNVTTTAYDNAGNTVAITDALGHTATAVYDVLNRVVVNVDALGNRTTTVYDAAGNVSAVTDALTHTSSYFYDTLNRKTTVIDALGNRATMAYDSVNNVLAVTDANNHTTSYLYDADNRRTVTIDALGNRTTTTYDADSNVISRQDANNHVTTLSYDSLNRPIATIDALGNRTTTLYDAQGHEAGTVDQLGNTTQTVYDDLGRVVQQVDALGNLRQTVFDASGNILATVDPMNHRTAFLYDGDNRRIQVTDALGNLATTVYDAVSNPLVTVDARGNRTTLAYDADNRPISRTDALNHTTSTIYDAAGNVARSLDALGNATTFGYDADDRRTTSQSPSGAVISTVYDAAGNVVNTIDGLGDKTTFVFDADNRRTATIDAKAGTTTSVFDNVGNQVNVIDSVGNKTTFIYDALNRVTQQTDPLGHSGTFAFDAAGRQTSQTDRLGRRTDSSYDADNRLTGQTWVSGGSTVNTLTFTYDAVGNPLTAADTNGAYTMVYDARNMLSVLNGMFGTTLTYTYDAAANRTQAQDSLSGTTTSVFNAVNALTTREFGGPGQTTMRIDLTYTARDQVATESRYSDLAGTTLVGTSTFGYDTSGRQTNLQHKDAAGTNIASYVYSYDLADRLLTEKLNGSTTSYLYDVTNQLATVTNGSGSTTYGYDANGNRTNTGYTTGTENQLTNDGTWTYTYDAEGNLSHKNKASNTEIVTYTYDNRDRLTNVSDWTTLGTTVVAYKYDVFDQRIETDLTPAGGVLTVTRFAYDGPNVWVDLDNSNHLVTRRLYMDGVDALFARINSAGTAGWYLPDRLGSIRDIENYAGTSALDHVDYDGYGGITNETQPANGDRYKYTGREWDSAAALQENRERYYDPRTGRWLTQDPLGFGAGDALLYRYVGNDPTNALDPSGLTTAEQLPSMIASYQLNVDYAVAMGRLSASQAPAAKEQMRLAGIEAGIFKVTVNQPPKVDYFERASNFAAGMGDTVSLGLTRKIRQAANYDDVVDTNSSAYRYGTYAGQAVNVGLMVANPVGAVGWTATGLRTLHQIQTAGAIANGTEAALEGNYLEAGMSFAGVALPGVKLPCPVVTGLKVGMQAVGAVNLSESAWGKYQSGDYLGAGMDVLELGVSLSQPLISCFAARTPLLTPTGAKRIEEFRVGDLLLSRSEYNAEGALEPKVVEEVFVRTGQVLHLHVAGKVIRTSPEHPFWVQGKGWLAASQLAVGDRLLSDDGQWVAVEEVYDTGEYETVYNLRVADFHTYFVGGEEWGFSVWAHNASCASNSKKLGKALYADGQPNMTIDGQAAHVVPSGNWSRSKRSPAVKQAIVDAQAALAGEGIGINSAPNGFWATAGHNGTHTDAYLLQLGDRMNLAVQDGNVTQILNKIRLENIAGAF